MVKFGDKCCVESISALRLVSKKLGLYGSDAEADYLQDMAADIAVEFRCAAEDAYCRYTFACHRVGEVLKAFFKTPSRGSRGNPQLHKGTV